MFLQVLLEIFSSAHTPCATWNSSLTEFLVSGSVDYTVQVTCAAAKYTYEISMRMVMVEWTFKRKSIILLETNEKEAISTCRFHAYGGILSEQA
jgi:hypothetical protein